MLIHRTPARRGFLAAFAIVAILAMQAKAALSDGGMQTPRFDGTRVVFTNFQTWLAQVKPLGPELVVSKTIPSQTGDYYVAISRTSPRRYALFVYSTRYHAMEHFGWGFRDAQGKPITITNNGLITRQYQVPIPSGSTTMTIPYGTDILFDSHTSGEINCQIAVPAVSGKAVSLVDLKFTLK